MLLLLSPLACPLSPSSLAAVSGKTVYTGMALEGVTILVLRWQEGKWESFAATRIGYHGFFIVHLTEEKYLLTARTILRKASGNPEMEIKMQGLKITGYRRRVNRLILELRPGGP